MPTVRLSCSCKFASTVLIFCALWSEWSPWPLSAEGARREGATGLPLVIPHPQVMVKVGNQSIVLGQEGRIVARIVLPRKEGFFREARNLIEGSLHKMGFSGKPGSSLSEVVITTRSMAAEKTRAPGPDALSLAPAEEDALGKSDQAYVLRMRPGKKPVIWVLGASPLGAYYGATTLVQLIETQGATRAVVGNTTVQDYPDIPYRMCADWVLNSDWDANCYDWGDGPAAFIARTKRKIDMCSRYKVNMVRFLGGRIAPGPDYMAQRYPMIKRFGLELNRYARSKGVALQYSSVSWGCDYGVAGVGPPGGVWPWILNREHYPGGETYSCSGELAGCCLSNDALTQAIARRNRQLVEDIEPGSVYLHHLDVASYSELVRVWQARCQRCRLRYPDDEPFSPTGYAGAVAHLYNTLLEELKSVKNRDSGYDASRDLQIVFASPGYTQAGDSDAEWEKSIKFVQEVGRQLKDKRNVHLTFREQFKRYDDKGLRTEEMARCLAEVGWPHAVFMFAIQGADFWVDNHMLVSSPVLTETYRRASVIYNFNGHVHSEVQVLANANYAWNHHAPGWVAPAPFKGDALRAEASRYARGLQHSDYLYGRFLSAACAKLYGERAAPYIAAMFRLEKEKGPLCPVLTALVMRKYWESPDYDWSAQAERNVEAKALVDKALAVCDREARADLAWLSKCLEVGARIGGFYHLVRSRQLPIEEADAKANGLLAWLDRNFQFRKAEPDGGDPSVWRGLVTRAQNEYAKAFRRRVLEEEGVTVEASSALEGYSPLSVLTSDRTGKDWGQDGGWNDATAGVFPDTLEILFKTPRYVKRVDAYTLADNWREVEAVDADTEFQQLGVTDVDVEWRDPKGNWAGFEQIRHNRKVLLPLPDLQRQITGIRLRVLGTGCGMWSRIVHVDLR